MRCCDELESSRSAKKTQRVEINEWSYKYKCGLLPDCDWRGIEFFFPEARENYFDVAVTEGMLITMEKTNENEIDVINEDDDDCSVAMSDYELSKTIFNLIYLIEDIK